MRNTPTLETSRLLLRKFTQEDIPALLSILQDEEVNTFLPWFPLKNLTEASAFFEARYARAYQQPQAYQYAICLKAEDGQTPIGYIGLSMEESHDLGYGLKREYWGQGIAEEAAKALIERLQQDGIPFITATHDVNNARSGGVMRKLGMDYCYTYLEQWQPKDIPVYFRMYQRNLTDPDAQEYPGYWNQSQVHFVEDLAPKEYVSKDGSPIAIRQETAQDRPMVYRLIQEAFASAPHRDGTEQDLVEALRKSQAFLPKLSLVAEIKGRLAGHILFTKAKVGEDTVLALAPLSVSPEFQGQGVGTALIEEGHRIARILGFSYSIVLGSETYYPRLGYLPAHSLGVQVPEGIPSENFMAVKLLEMAAPIHGAMIYAPEFGMA